jgi:prepilin-type N-terminal cleavage/methylation domain-containing protein
VRRRWICQSGVTLIELAVVLALVGIVGGAIGATLVRQQRYYRGAGDLLSARGTVRDAMEVLSTDVRGMAVADTPTLMTDSAFEFFANIGSAIVCQAATGPEVGLAGASSAGARGNVLTSLLVQPDTGDLAVFYQPAPDGGERWERARIAAFASRPLSSSCPGGSAFAIGAGGKGFTLVLAAPLTGSIREGAPVRFTRRGRYSLYRASDGEWYLGYRRCNAVGAPSCGAVQPLSGPYRSYSRNGDGSGLLFEYFDAEGNRIDGSAASSLALVRLTARAGNPEAAGGSASTVSDSASVAIALRNRLP